MISQVGGILVRTIPWEALAGDLLLQKQRYTSGSQPVIGGKLRWIRDFFS